MATVTRVGFLGCGKIGGAMLEDMLANKNGRVSFVQARTYQDKENRFPVVRAADPTLLAGTDLVVETATADALKADFDAIIGHCDLMPFSTTAFADQAFHDHAKACAAKYGRSIYMPHGAILGLDGIMGGRSLITEVSIETIKPPASLGRNETERTVLYDGPTREACALFPRNVNVHAVLALAGIGFDRTRSVIVSDPGVDTNSHIITVKGEGIYFRVETGSFATGGVTGKYAPYSACVSLAQVLDKGGTFRFV